MHPSTQPRNTYSGDRSRRCLLRFFNRCNSLLADDTYWSIVALQGFEQQADALARQIKSQPSIHHATRMHSTGIGRENRRLLNERFWPFVAFQGRDLARTRAKTIIKRAIQPLQQLRLLCAL